MVYLDRVQCDDALHYLKGIPDNTFNCCVTSPPYYGLRKYTDGNELELGLNDTPEDYVDRLVTIFRELRRTLRDDGTLFLNLGDTYATGTRAGRPPYSSTGQVGANRPEAQNSVGRNGNPYGLAAKQLCMIPSRVVLALQADGWYLRSAMPWVKVNPMPESTQDRPTTGHEYVFLLTKSPRYWYDAFAVKRPVAASTVNRGLVSFGGEKGRNYTPDEDDPNYRGGNEQWGRTFDYAESCKNGRSYRTTDAWFDSVDYMIDSLIDFRENGGLLHDENGTPVGVSCATQPCNWEYCKHCGQLYVGKERKQIKKEKVGRRTIKHCTCGQTDGWVEHFAMFPPRLIEPFILAGCPERVCSECGTPYIRQVKSKSASAEAEREYQGVPVYQPNRNGRTQEPVGSLGTPTQKDLGLVASCDCTTSTSPGIVVDPFAGSGTTLRVAQSFGRHFAGCDLNPDYVTVANKLLGVEDEVFE